MKRAAGASGAATLGPAPKCLGVLVVSLLLACAAMAQQPPSSLAEILQAITAAGANVQAVSAHADVADYTALVNDTSRSSGMLYFKRTAHGPMYVLDITSPAAAAKKLVYRDQTAYVYTPASKQVMKYALGAKQEAVNQYLLLGIGGSAADLTKSFQVKSDGATPLAGEPTVKLTLFPLPAQSGSKITHIDIWYSTKTWLAVQQQIWQVGGDYHLVHYSDLKVNPKLSDKIFSTSFPGATVVTPNQ